MSNKEIPTFLTPNKKNAREKLFQGSDAHSQSASKASYPYTSYTELKPYMRGGTGARSRIGNTSALGHSRKNILGYNQTSEEFDMSQASFNSSSRLAVLINE